MFDAASFLNQTTTGAHDTRYTPIPIGDYAALITEVGARQQPNPEKPGEVWTMLDITYATDDQRAKEATGLDRPTIRQTLFLELDANGKVDNSKGKNVPLGRVRDATGLNDPNQEFRFQMLVGKPVIVSVVHNPKKGDPETIYSNVGKIGKL